MLLGMVVVGTHSWLKWKLHASVGTEVLVFDHILARLDMRAVRNAAYSVLSLSKYGWDGARFCLSTSDDLKVQMHLMQLNTLAIGMAAASMTKTGSPWPLV